MKILKGLLMIITAPVILVLTLFVWLCMGLIYICLLYTSLYPKADITVGGFETTDRRDFFDLAIAVYTRQALL